VDIAKSNYEIPKIEMDYHVATPHQTLNSPNIVVGKDTETYFVKFNEKDNARIGINELICNLIGLKLELPLFDPIIAIVSEDLINSKEQLKEFPAGEHFAQKYLEPLDTVGTYTSLGRELTEDAIGNVRHVPDFLIFDKYIENYDRHEDNICLLPNETITDKVDYYLFDHDLAFQRDIIRKGSVKDIRNLKQKLKYMFFLVEGITKRRLFDRIYNKIDLLKKDIPDIMKAIPPNWVVGHENYINEVEIVLNNFTVDIVDTYLELNRDKLPFLK